MTDVQIRAFIRAQLLVLLPLYGMANVQVIADYQPTQQGRETGPAIYIHSLGEEQEGRQSSRYQPVPSIPVTLRRTERQMLATTMQITVYAPEDATLTPPLPTDLARVASMALQSVAFVEALVQQYPGSGVRRVTPIRRPYIVNDRGQFEQSPSFDITLAHTVSIVVEAPQVDAVQYGIHRV